VEFDCALTPRTLSSMSAPLISSIRPIREPKRASAFVESFIRLLRSIVALSLKTSIWIAPGLGRGQVFLGSNILLDLGWGLKRERFLEENFWKALAAWMGLCYIAGVLNGHLLFWGNYD